MSLWADTKNDPTFKDRLLSACQNFRPQKTPPQTGYHLRSKQLLVFRSNCKTSIPNILKKKKLIQAVLPELAHEVTRNQKLTRYQDLVYCVKIRLARTYQGNNLGNEYFHFFPCFIVICVSKSGPQTKKQ